MAIDSVYIFLFDGYSDWEISYITPELRKSEKINLQYFTVDGLPIRSMGGLRVTPDKSIKDLNTDKASVLILPGGTAWEEQLIEGIDQIVADLHSGNKTIAAICAATTYLGQKGYLNEVKHTSNALAYLQHMAPNYKGEKNYQEEPAVADQHIITANGTAPIEFAREIFRKIALYETQDIEKWYQLFKHGLWTA